MLLCKDCKYARRDWVMTGLWCFASWWKIIWPPWFMRGIRRLWKYASCCHPVAAVPQEVDVVSGITTKAGRYRSCDYMRMFVHDRCGEEARFFEPKDG